MIVYRVRLIETFSSKKTPEKNGSGNDRLPKRNRESTNDSTDIDERHIGSTKISKYLLPTQESVRSRFLSGQ